MSRAYVFYILSFAAMVGGLWVILILGTAATAPDDLSGDWVVEWDNAPPPEAVEPTMNVSQSGKYFVVRFGERPPISMVLEDGWTGKRKGRLLKMRLKERRWTLDVRGDIPPQERFRVPEVRVELVGPTRHVGVARRVIPQTVDANEGDDTAAPKPADTTPPPAPPAAAETAHAR